MNKKCECIETLLYLVKTGEYPIELNERHGEFVIRGRSGNRVLPLRHCPYCGLRIRLPNTPTWSDMDEHEIDLAREQTKKCKDVHTLINEFGEPEYVLQCNTAVVDGISFANKADKEYVYGHRWHTFEMVAELLDEKVVGFVFRPKRLS